MLRIAAVIVVLMLASPPAIPQNADEAARGKRWLEKVGRAWMKEVPFERRIAVYWGTRWAGSTHFAVTLAAPDSGAAFDVQWSSHMQAPLPPVDAGGHALLNADLTVVREETHGRVGEIEDHLITVWQDGRLESTLECQGRTTRKTFDPGSRPGWNVALLSFSEVPEEVPLTVLQVPEKIDGECTWASITPVRSDAPWDRAVSAAERPRFELRLGTKTMVWLCNDSGRVFEIAHREAPVRIRSIAETQAGKDLAPAPALSPPAEALCELFQAVARGDDAAALAMFDLPGMVASSYPDFSYQDQARPEDALAEMRGRLLETWMPNIRKSAAKAPEFQEYLRCMVECRTEGDDAQVVLPGIYNFRLRNSHDGGRAGAWLVCSFESW